jgi:hypothetical protein
MTKISIQLASFLAAILLLAPLSNAAETAQKSSGFLQSDIEAKLEKSKLPNGREIMIWKSPELTRKNYQGIMVDSVTFYPAPHPGPQISSSTLDGIVAYSTKALRERVGARLNLVDKAGPGVVRMQAVFTAVTVKKEGMSAADIIPIHFLFSAAKSAAGETDMDVVAHLELRIVDSVSGEYRAAGKMELTGEKLKNSKQSLAVKDLQKSIDSAATGGAQVLDEIK